MKDWLDREIQEKEYLRSILFTNARLVPLESPEHTLSNEDLKPVNRYVPFRIKRAKREMERRKEAQAMRDTDKTEGERLFELELEKVK